MTHIDVTVDHSIFIGRHGTFGRGSRFYFVRAVQPESQEPELITDVRPVSRTVSVTRPAALRPSRSLVLNRTAIKKPAPAKAPKRKLLLGRKSR